MVLRKKVFGICCKCKKKITKKISLKKCPSGTYCTKCHQEKRKKKQDYLLHNVAGVKRRKKLEREWALKRKAKEQRNFVPEIKGAKRKKPNINFHLGLFLTRNEREFIYKKLQKKGLDEKEIKLRINQVTKNVKEILDKEKIKEKTKKEIDATFKEEFAKLIESY